MKVDLFTEDRKIIADKIKTARNRAGISQKNLAAEIGIREQTYLDIEKGRGYQINTLFLVAKRLNLTLKLSDNKRLQK